VGGPGGVHRAACYHCPGSGLQHSNLALTHAPPDSLILLHIPHLFGVQVYDLTFKKKKLPLKKPALRSEVGPADFVSSKSSSEL